MSGHKNSSLPESDKKNEHKNKAVPKKTAKKVSKKRSVPAVGHKSFLVKV